MTDNRLVFLDTETTGLNPALHEVWEVAWAVDDGWVYSSVVPHSLATAQPAALAVGRYRERVTQAWSGSEQRTAEYGLRRTLQGATVVGANPAFDTSFLRARWGDAPWHYRLVDVEAAAMFYFGWDRPKGLAAVAVALRDEGLDVPEPDHTAAGDVETVRSAYRALRVLHGGGRAAR